VDTGSPQKMRPSKEIERIHVSWKHEFALSFFSLALSGGKPDSTFPESALIIFPAYFSVSA
jgi:hypothetical protein